MAVGPGAFPPGSPILTFDGLAEGTEVNGLSYGGVSFTYTVGGSPLNGAVVIDGGPGMTNNIAPPNIVSVGNNAGTLNLVLPGASDLFGYGYALLASGTIANATTISLFSGTTSVGSLSYSGAPDPAFTGGFAGIESTIPFDRVALTFESTQSLAFAVDNIRFVTVTNIPEPSTVLLAAAGLLLCISSKGFKALARRPRFAR